MPWPHDTGCDDAVAPPAWNAAYCGPMAKKPPPPNGTPDWDDDDAALFRAAIGPVRELPPADPRPARPRPRPGTRMAELDDADARDEFLRLLDEAPVEAGDTLRHRRDDVPSRVLKRLAQGEYAVQDEIDLHHASAAAAADLLRRFLHDAGQAGMRCVRVIHGKGLNSEGVPVLKNLCDRLLRQRGDVLAFHSAPPAQGGTGAVLVLLRPRRTG
ncbi:DNA-nicking Smr family endonuclease [Luteimonas sp. J16]|jgi:DNA-nicking Smr family endonuclease|nr:DNA-nicking Smr family endonuclease [Luteimonas sp. J16]